MMRIVSFGQQVLLDSSMTVVNQITIELPDGRQVAVPTSEETVQMLMKLHAGIDQDAYVEVGDGAVQGSAEVDAAALQYVESLDAAEGDDDDPGELHSVPDDVVGDTLMGALSEAPASAPVPRRAGIGQTQQQRPNIDADGFLLAPKARTVPKDEMGYPIVQRRSGPPQQQELVADEDGEQI